MGQHVEQTIAGTSIAPHALDQCAFRLNDHTTVGNQVYHLTLVGGFKFERRFVEPKEQLSFTRNHHRTIMGRAHYTTRYTYRPCQHVTFTDLITTLDRHVFISLPGRQAQAAPDVQQEVLWIEDCLCDHIGGSDVLTAACHYPPRHGQKALAADRG